MHQAENEIPTVQVMHASVFTQCGHKIKVPLFNFPDVYMIYISNLSLNSALYPQKILFNSTTVALHYL